MPQRDDRRATDRSYLAARAFDPATSQSGLVRLARHKDAFVRLAAVESDRLPFHRSVALARDPDAGVRAAVARRVAGDPMLESMFDDEVDEGVLAELRASTHEKDPVREHLSRHTDHNLRAIAARGTRLKSIQRALASDPAVEVRVALTTNPWIDDEVTAYLLSDDQAIEVLQSALKITWIPRGELARFSTHANAEIRALVAAHPHCGPDVLGELMMDDDVQVRAAVAGNAALEARDQSVLLRDASTEVREALLDNPSLSDQTLTSLMVEDPDRTIRTRAQRVILFRHEEKRNQSMFSKATTPSAVPAGGEPQRLSIFADLRLVSPELVAQIAGALDALHRIRGGGGLELDGLEIGEPVAGRQRALT